MPSAQGDYRSNDYRVEPLDAGEVIGPYRNNYGSNDSLGNEADFPPLPSMREVIMAVTITEVEPLDG